eukprot:10321513-Heterocapsa_arctica.AAC.1
MRGSWADELACGSATVKLNQRNQRYPGALLQDLSGLAHEEREVAMAIVRARQRTRRSCSRGWQDGTGCLG